MFRNEEILCLPNIFSFTNNFEIREIKNKYLKKDRGVVRGGKKGLKLPFKYYRNAVFSLMLSNEKLHFETNSKLIIPCVKSREFYSVT